jgi:hypothetical protein
VAAAVRGKTTALDRLWADADAAAAPPRLSPDAAAGEGGSATAFPLFDRALGACEEDVAAFAGTPHPTRIARPVDLSLVPDAVASLSRAADALRAALHCCNLLANQERTFKNTVMLRASLIQHLVVRTLPLPLPVAHPSRGACCFWRAEPMSRAAQCDLLRLLSLVAGHFAAACLSLKVSRSFDASRIVTLGCLTAIADAVVRRPSSDAGGLTDGAFQRHYAGEAPGPGEAFGVTMGGFAEMSATLLLTDPALVLARTQVHH